MQQKSKENKALELEKVHEAAAAVGVRKLRKNGGDASKLTVAQLEGIAFVHMRQPVKDPLGSGKKDEKVAKFLEIQQRRMAHRAHRQAASAAGSAASAEDEPLQKKARTAASLGADGDSSDDFLGLFSGSSSKRKREQESDSDEEDGGSDGEEHDGGTIYSRSTRLTRTQAKGKASAGGDGGSSCLKSGGVPIDFGRCPRAAPRRDGRVKAGVRAHG